MMAEALDRWLREEMEVPPSAVPSPAALRRLCSSPTAPVWDFVIRHVRNQRNVKKIRGNLRWSRHLQEVEAAASPPSRQRALLAARARLRQELRDVTAATAHAQETARRLELSLGAGQSRRWAELRRGAELRLLGAEPRPEGLRGGLRGALQATPTSQSRAELSAILALGAEPEVLSCQSPEGGSGLAETGRGGADWSQPGGGALGPGGVGQSEHEGSPVWPRPLGRSSAHPEAPPAGALGGRGGGLGGAAAAPDPPGTPEGTPGDTPGAGPGHGRGCQALSARGRSRRRPFLPSGGAAGGPKTPKSGTKIPKIPKFGPKIPKIGGFGPKTVSEGAEAAAAEGAEPSAAAAAAAAIPERRHQRAPSGAAATAGAGGGRGPGSGPAPSGVGVAAAPGAPIGRAGRAPPPAAGPAPSAGIGWPAQLRPGGAAVPGGHFAAAAPPGGAVGAPGGVAIPGGVAGQRGGARTGPAPPRGRGRAAGPAAIGRRQLPAANQRLATPPGAGRPMVVPTGPMGFGHAPRSRPLLPLAAALAGRRPRPAGHAHRRAGHAHRGERGGARGRGSAPLRRCGGADWSGIKRGGAKGRGLSL
nr:HAUS augmin-like complex subunit 5 isoform X1 [Taeniopygia guttata]